MSYLLALAFGTSREFSRCAKREHSRVAWPVRVKDESCHTCEMSHMWKVTQVECVSLRVARLVQNCDVTHSGVWLYSVTNVIPGKTAGTSRVSSRCEFSVRHRWVMPHVHPQHTHASATHCNTWQQTATQCNTLQRTSEDRAKQTVFRPSALRIDGAGIPESACCSVCCSVCCSACCSVCCSVRCSLYCSLYCSVCVYVAVCELQ